MKRRGKLISFLAFLALVVLTLLALTSQSKDFTLEGFLSYARQADPLWIALAFVGMLGFVFFEGEALHLIYRGLGWRGRLSGGVTYAAADIFFSAITPSATGGQPASAYLMIMDGLNPAITTATLLLNLVLYTASIVVIGLISLIFRPSAFLCYSLPSQLLIGAGLLVQLLLSVGMLILALRERIILRICEFFLRLLTRVHLIRHPEKRREQLLKMCEEYRACIALVRTRPWSIIGAFVMDFLQRACLIAVPVCVYMAIGGSGARAFDVWAAQSMVVLGSNFVPLPGAVGIADLLFIDGFRQFTEDVLSLELLSRGISFYCCVLICGLVVLVLRIAEKLKRMGNKAR